MLYNFTLCCLLACLDTILSSMHTVTCLYLSQWLPDKDLSSEPLSPLVSLQSSGWRCGDVCWSLWWVSVYQLFLCHCRHHPGLLYWTPAHNGIINTTWCDSTCLYHLALYWSISLSSKIRLMRFLVTSTFLYACESWTLTAELQRRIQAMEMRCYHKIQCFSYKDLVQRRGSLCQDPAGNWTKWRPPDYHKEMQTAVVWSCLPFIRSGQTHLARHSEGRKKTRQTEEEVGRQHQGMHRPGGCQVPEGNGEQGKMEETGCKIICGAPATLAVKG